MPSSITSNATPSTKGAAARALVAEAEATADAKLRAAEAEAAGIVRDAERDAQAFTERSTVALEHAGRDLLITVRRSIDEPFTKLIRASLDEELRPGLLAEMLVKMAEAYTAHGGRERRMAVLLNERDLDALARLHVERYRERMAQGVELRLDESVRRGYRVQIVGEHVAHDFTIDAITEELSRHLRPRLAEMLPRAAVSLTRGEEGRCFRTCWPAFLRRGTASGPRWASPRSRPPAGAF